MERKLKCGHEGECAQGLWELIIVTPYLSGRGEGREGPPDED